MSRKRDKPYFSRHVPYSYPKRRRPLPPHQPDATTDNDLPENTTSKPLTTVVVAGLSPECSVLDLKSRFEIYGSISRTRMDPGGLAYITFRSKDSADSAIAASLDPSFGITLHSQRVQVMWASDPVPQWREAVGHKDGSSSSKLLKAGVPLSRHGRGDVDTYCELVNATMEQFQAAFLFAYLPGYDQLRMFFPVQTCAHASVMCAISGYCLNSLWYLEQGMQLGMRNCRNL